MSVTSLLNGIYGSSNSNHLYGITQNLISQSTSMDSRIYAAVQQLNSGASSDKATSAAYSDIDTFLKSYQSELNGLVDTASSLQLSNKQSIFSEYENGEADLDDIVSAVGEFIDSYNSVTSLLGDNADRGAGTASHLGSFTRGVASDSALEMLGISYDKDGKMVLDSEALKTALEEDYDTAASLIGGQYGFAERASMKAEHALQDSVQRIVSNDLNSLINSTQSYSNISYTYNFNKAGAYNLSNMYAVGLFVNTLA